MAGTGDTFRALPRAAQGYLTTVGAAAAAAAAIAARGEPSGDSLLIALVIVLCVAAKAFEAFAPGHYALQPGYAALVFGSLLAPAWAIPLFALACFALDLHRGGPALYKTVFNIANYTLVGILISSVGEPGTVWALTLAALAGAVANHALIVYAIALAGEQPLRGTLRQLTDGLPLSVATGLTGRVLAVLWTYDPVYVVLAAGPIGLLIRALWVPMLRHRADSDAKTGLYHSERIREELEEQIAGGRRVAVAMIDLDHLRTINSRCGHLAGDRAIRAVADELGAVAAEHGAAGRFGGEEFCLVLPGADAKRAKELLDGIQDRLAFVEFREAADVQVSFSAGVAVHPDHGDSVDALLSAADTALYDAKAAGRHRVRIALSAAARNTLQAAPLSPAPEPEQPLPAASAAHSRIIAVMAALGGRRAEDGDGSRLLRAQSDLEDTLDLVGRMHEAYLKTLVSLARAVEDKDPYTAGATLRIGVLATRLAETLGCSETDRRSLQLGVELRDLGRAGVRDAVVHKGGPLDPMEREEIRAHAELTTSVLAELELPLAVKQMVRSHHERWDGTGYPDRLAGDEIPLTARILAVAEALDAMLSRRPYRPALPLENALAELTAGAGSQFCPLVASAAASCFTESVLPQVNVAVHSSNPLRTAEDGPTIDAMAGAK